MKEKNENKTNSKINASQNLIIFYQETVSLGVHEKKTKSIASMAKAFS